MCTGFVVNVEVFYFKSRKARSVNHENVWKENFFRSEYLLSFFWEKAKIAYDSKVENIAKKLSFCTENNFKIFFFSKNIKCEQPFGTKSSKLPPQKITFFANRIIPYVSMSTVCNFLSSDNMQRKIHAYSLLIYKSLDN
jgi:hypothetical protein